MYVVGTSGWSYRHWRGRFYPPDLPRWEWFPFYIREFATVELNVTFYRLPSRKRFEEWARIAAQRPGFVFAVKAPRPITHVRRLVDAANELQQFLQAPAGAGPQVGHVDPLADGREGLQAAEAPAQQAYRPPVIGPPQVEKTDPDLKNAPVKLPDRSGLPPPDFFQGFVALPELTGVELPDSGQKLRGRGLGALTPQQGSLGRGKGHPVSGGGRLPGGRPAQRR